MLKDTDIVPLNFLLELLSPIKYNLFFMFSETLKTG